MAGTSGSPAQLGADNVIRFLDAEHFLKELAGHLGRGRALVRTRRTFQPRDRIAVEIEAPGVAWRVACEAEIVSLHKGFIALEFLEFEDRVLPDLDALGSESERHLKRQPPSEKTVVGPAPKLSPERPVAQDVSPEPPVVAARARGRRRRPAAKPPTPPPAPGRNRPRPTSAPVAKLPPASEPPKPPPKPSTPNRLPAPSKRPSTPLPELTGMYTMPEEDPSTTPPPPPPPPARLDSEELLTDSRTPMDPLKPDASDPWDFDDEGRTAFEFTPVPNAGLLEDDDLLESQTRDDLQILDEPPSFLSEAPPEDRDALSRFDPPIEKLDVRAVSLPAPSRPKDPTADEPAPAPEVIEERFDPVDEVTGEAVQAEGFDASAPAEATPAKAPDPPTPTEAEAPPSEPAPVPETALKTRHPAVVRITPGGVLRVTDTVDLLGLYLSQIRHGRMTAFGGPEGEVDETIPIKVAGPSVVTLTATIFAKVGDWVTLAIEDPSPVMDILRETSEEWQTELAAIAPRSTPPAPAAVTPPAPPPAPIAPAPIAPAPTSPPAPPAPAPSAELPMVARASAEHASTDLPALDAEASSARGEAAPAPVVDENAPPEPPHIQGDAVVFGRIKDLKHEIEANLKNGGLFVRAAPLPIRARRNLRVKVGAKLWPVELQADVVFADHGKVGFSVTNASDARLKLQTILDAGGPESLEMEAVARPEVVTGDLPDALAPAEPPPDPPPVKTDPSQQNYKKVIEAPLPTAKLLRLSSTKIDGDTLDSAPQLSALQVVEFVVRNRWRGVLTLHNSSQTYTAWFHEGSIAFLKSSQPDETTSLGRILMNHKKLTEAALREALDKSKSNGRSLGRSLIALGHIKKNELASALREQVRARMAEAMEVERGELRWAPWNEPPGDADLVLTRGLGVLGHFLRYRFEALNFADLETVFGKNMTRPVGHDPNLDQLASGLYLQPKELRFLELQLDGKRALRDAVQGSPIGRLASLRLVAVCLALDVVYFTDGRRLARETTKLRKVSLHHLQLMKDYQEKLDTYQRMNYFEVLGVHWSAHHRNYRQAFERARMSLDPKRRPLRDAPPEVLEVAKESLSIVERAFRTLKEPKSRANYRESLFDATEREYAADMLVKQGEVALMRGDRVGAMECLETAVELDPTDRNKSLLMSAREGRR